MFGFVRFLMHIPPLLKFPLPNEVTPKVPHDLRLDEKKHPVIFLCVGHFSSLLPSSTRPCFRPFRGPQYHLLKSRLPLTLPPSRLGRIELLELRLLRARCSPGSVGRKPLDRANKFRISVNEMTPVSFPDRWAPAMAAAGTAFEGVGKTGVDKGSGLGGAEAWLFCAPPVVAPAVMTVADMDGDTLPAAGVGPNSGVSGALGLGDALSTTHMRWERVATSLATVWASVE